MTKYPNPAEDDAYRSLFRQDDFEPVGFPEEYEPVGFPERLDPVRPSERYEPVGFPERVEPVGFPERDEPVGYAVTPALLDREPADTGRLFRSVRVKGDADAIVVLRPEQASQLRTLASSAAPMPVGGTTGAGERLVVIGDADDIFLREEVPKKARGRVARKAERAEKGQQAGSQSHNSRTSASERPMADPSDRGLRGLGVYLIMIGVTLAAGLADVVVAGPGLGWPTGAALVVAGTFCAFRVRRSDAAVAVTAPAIAFLLACVTVGQIGVISTGGVILGRGVTVFFALADNWMWIVGTTLIALVIVLLRARRRQ